MKFPPPQLAYFLQEPTNRRNVLLLFKLLLVLVGIVAVYSILFHLLMMREDRDYTWVTGIYWTLTVMSTLGFGDITFEGDLGRAPVALHERVHPFFEDALELADNLRHVGA